MLPPKVFQNKVTIHRVRGGYTPEELKKFEQMREELQDEYQDEYEVMQFEEMDR
jgi:hypothetical protein